MATRIISVPASEQFENDTIDYMIEVNRKRQIPSSRDGLKFVQRRILDTMTRFLNCFNKTVKSQSIVGRTMEISHPHGGGVYEAMKPLTNWFEELHPLITKQGSFGTKYGDPAAAPRYTEAKISQFAKEALGLYDLKDFESITDWLTTYNNDND